MPRKRDAWAREDAPTPRARPPVPSLGEPYYLARARGTALEQEAVFQHAGEHERIAETDLDHEAERIYGHMPAREADWELARDLAALRLRGA